MNAAIPTSSATCRSARRGRWPRRAPALGLHFFWPRSVMPVKRPPPIRPATRASACPSSRPGDSRGSARTPAASARHTAIAHVCVLCASSTSSPLHSPQRVNGCGGMGSAGSHLWKPPGHRFTHHEQRLDRARPARPRSRGHMINRPSSAAAAIKSSSLPERQYRGSWPSQRSRLASEPSMASTNSRGEAAFGVRLALW